MLEQLKELACHGAFADAKAVLESALDPVEALNDCQQAVKNLYWKEKNLPAVVGLATVGIQVGEGLAASDRENAHEILCVVKGLCFDLASFTWTGWDEPAISPTSLDLELGLDAARKNLRYAIDLDRGNVPTARGHWMLGACLLTAGSFEDAYENFEKTHQHWAGVDNPGEQMLCEGFALLAQSLAGNVGASEALATHLATMDSVPSASSFTNQIRTAQRVLGQL